MFSSFRAGKKKNWKTILGISLQKIASFEMYLMVKNKKIKGKSIHNGKKTEKQIKTHKTMFGS